MVGRFSGTAISDNDCIGELEALIMAIAEKIRLMAPLLLNAARLD